MNPPAPNFQSDPPRLAEKLTFNTHDGAEHGYRYWPAADGKQPRGAILLFHRGHEHGGRMAHLVDELKLPDFAFYAWDARGHGLSPGERGDAPDFATLVRDVDDFVRHIGERDGVATEDIAVVAQSVGAVVISAWIHDYAPKIRAQVVAAPAFDVNLYVPLAKPGLRLLYKLRGNFFVKSYVKARWLTHDPERIASYESDPLISRPISARVLLGLYEAAERVVRDAGAIRVPTQLLVSGADRVVRQKPQHRFFANLGSAEKERHVLPGFFHDTLGERGRAGVVAEVRRFLADAFAQPAFQPDLRDAHQRGYTRDEVRKLATPLSWKSPSRLIWGTLRGLTRFGSRFSHGLALGRRTGFDSGATLDYVYRNQAQGVGWLGRAIDRGYLDAIGWRGIRQRKLHLEELISATMTRLSKSGSPVRILDIAAGHGRYVLEAVAGSDVDAESIVLRDFDQANVEAGRMLISELGRGANCRFERGDAFDGASLAEIKPSPTLAIVSGLYELFADNERVRGSLSGLAAAIPPGGYLIYTGQPWHPQLEQIARTLTSHRAGRPWVMRRRTQMELDQLVAEAGFAKIEQRIDRWGIFTVSVARRPCPPPSAMRRCSPKPRKTPEKRLGTPFCRQT